MDNNTRNQIIEKIQSIRGIFSCIALLFIFCVLGYLCVDALEKKMYPPCNWLWFFGLCCAGTILDNAICQIARRLFSQAIQHTAI
ncbi:hypothetical protein [Dictyobacter aurantiacus]|uniref:hypothetical protein n=1 Tax=Dictyobacter aurantiacus TaxID=1936993 RepID=UPI000F82461A|nr:hypothetical protein [Dictyobacter aurantiacus]